MGKAQRHADRVAGKLVDVGSADAVALVARTRDDRPVGVFLEARTEVDLTAAQIERADGLHIDRTRQALGTERRIRRLVDGCAIDQFGWKLVEFD